MEPFARQEIAQIKKAGARSFSLRDSVQAERALALKPPSAAAFRGKAFGNPRGHANFSTMTAAEKIFEMLKAAPPGLAEEVLDFLEFLEARRKRRGPTPRAKFEDFYGALKDSSVFSEDPVALQRNWRDKWR
jgi:hypothetical protein